MPIPAVVAGSAIAGGSSLLGSILNLFGQSRANAQNIAMQRETNAQNYKMFQEQLQFAKEQQQLAMSYNDPSGQVARLRQAGVNPAAVFGNGSVAEASSINPPSAPNMVAPQVQPLDYSGIGAAGVGFVQSYFQNQLTNAQIDKTKNDSQISKVQAQIAQSTVEQKLAMIANDKQKSDFERETARRNLAILEATQANLIRQEALRTDVLDNQVIDLQLRNDAQRISNRIAMINLHWHNAEKSANFALFQANIKNAIAAARAHDASAVASFADAALSYAQRDGVRIDNKTKDEVQDEVIHQAELASEKAGYETLGANYDKDSRYWDSYERRKKYKYGEFLNKFIPGANGIWDFLFTGRGDRFKQ